MLIRQVSQLSIMATEATFTVPSDEFPLGSVFEGLPGVTVELERIVPGADVVVPYFWVHGQQVEDIEAAFTDHSGVADLHLVDSVNGQYLLKVEWASDYDGVLNALTELEIPLLKATGTNQEWTFSIRADDRKTIATFHQRCEDFDIPITLTKLHALTPIEMGTEQGLTDLQRQTLVLAYERGYFNSPRDVTMADLGEELGISQQAVASRLRRGIKRVLGETLAPVQPPSQPS